MEKGKKYTYPIVQERQNRYDQLRHLKTSSVAYINAKQKSVRLIVVNLTLFLLRSGFYRP